MITQFPSTPHVARPPRRRATSLMPSVVGTAAGLCREMAGRHLFPSWPEPRRLMALACTATAAGTAATAVGVVATIGGHGPFYPWSSLAIIAAGAAIGGLLVTRFVAALDAYERRRADAIDLIADDWSVETAKLRFEITTLRNKFHASGLRQEREGDPARSGATTEGERLPPASSVVEAPNVLRPQFPDFRRH